MGLFYKQRIYNMDLNEMMAQARELQTKVATAQDSLSKINVKGIAGDGAVIVDMTAKYDVQSVIISDEAMKNTPENLAKIVAQAFIDAKAKADAIIDKTMSDATQGVELPF